MKSLIFLLGSAMVRNWFTRGGHSARGQTSAPGMAKLNVPYISLIAKKYAANAGSALTFLLFFVSGTVMAIYTAAQSFDRSGNFVITNVFIAGASLAVFSAVVVFLNLRTIGQVKVDTDLLYLYEKNSSDQPERGFDLMKLAGPIISGIISGWDTKKETRPAQKNRNNEPESDISKRHIAPVSQTDPEGRMLN